MVNLNDKIKIVDDYGTETGFVKYISPKGNTVVIETSDGYGTITTTKDNPDLKKGMVDNRINA
tara:strand:- start:470 stop:658 length:189 start_codon:yes stop_codon:yes gene_type:complete